MSISFTHSYNSWCHAALCSHWLQLFIPHHLTLISVLQGTWCAQYLTCDCCDCKPFWICCLIFEPFHTMSSKKKKKGKWSDEYVQYGSMCTMEHDASHRPQCMIWNDKLSHSSLAPGKLNEHFLKPAWRWEMQEHNTCWIQGEVSQIWKGYSSCSCLSTTWSSQYCMKLRTWSQNRENYTTLVKHS